MVLVEAEESADPGGFGKMFADPGLIPKLANNPKTKHLLADPNFMRKVQRTVALICSHVNRVFIARAHEEQPNVRPIVRFEEPSLVPRSVTRFSFLGLYKIHK